MLVLIYKNNLDHLLRNKLHDKLHGNYMLKVNTNDHK